MCRRTTQAASRGSRKSLQLLTVFGCAWLSLSLSASLGAEPGTDEEPEKVYAKLKNEVEAARRLREKYG